MKNKIKIIFFLPHLKGGGAERVVSFIFKSLDRTIFEPYLIVLGFESEAQYIIEDENIIFLNKKRLRSALFDIFLKIWRLKPAVAFGSIGHINIYLGFLKFFFSKIKFIAREASVYTKMKSFNKRRQLPIFLLRKLYQKLDAIVYQSGDMKEDFQDTFNISPSKGYLIHNPVTFKFDKPSIVSEKKTSTYKFIIVGSLVINKGHERVLQLFEKVKFDYILEIIGDGPLRVHLENLVSNLKMSKKVIFREFQKDIEAIYASADFLIQGSFVEGFPNVVLEALSFGIPCIVFDAPGGHKEMILQGKNGFTINNKNEALDVITKATVSDWDRIEIHKDAITRFGPKIIIEQYEKLFYKISQ